MDSDSFYFAVSLLHSLHFRNDLLCVEWNVKPCILTLEGSIAYCTGLSVYPFVLCLPLVTKRRRKPGIDRTVARVTLLVEKFQRQR